MAFSEHYFIDRGDIICDECVDLMGFDVEYYMSEEGKEYFDRLDEETRLKIEEAAEQQITWLRISDNIDKDDDWRWEYL